MKPNRACLTCGALALGAAILLTPLAQAAQGAQGLPTDVSAKTGADTQPKGSGVPEPVTLVLSGGGAAAIWLANRRRRRGS